MTDSKIDLSKLREPFPPDDIEWRMQQSGLKEGRPWAKVLAYITARAIHDRLDEVCGPGNWQLRYLTHHSGTVCEIGIRVGSDWVWKAGGADDTAIESFKGGLSSSEKRAGVPWGIGRYLYKLDAGWANFDGNGEHSDKIEGTWYRWDPPPLPQWALPEGVTQAPAPKPKKTAPHGKGSELISRERYETALEKTTDVPDDVMSYILQDDKIGIMVSAKRDLIEQAISGLNNDQCGRMAALVQQWQQQEPHY